jgi:hypothetical protein
MDSVSSGHGPIAGSCEKCNGLLRSIKGGIYLEVVTVGKDLLVLI